MSRPRKRKTKKVNRQQRRWTILIIVLVSLLFRGIYFLQLNNSEALLHVHKWKQSDMHYFYEWAKDINAGDIWTEQNPHPYNHWQEVFANYSFQEYPAIAQKLVDNLPANTPKVERNKSLWSALMGGKAFFTDPLYAYLLALTSKIFGSNVFWVFAWQMLMGIGINVLIYLIAARYFGETTGIIAGFLAVFNAPLLFINLVLFRATLITFIGLVMIYWLDHLLKSKKRNQWLGYGIFIGLSLIVKSVYLLWVFFSIGCLFYVYRKKLPFFAQTSMLFLLGLLLGWLPLIVRNTTLDLPPFKSNGYTAMSISITNHNNYKIYSAGSEVEDYADILMKSEGKLIPTIVQTLQTHENIGSYFALTTRKFLSIWTGYEAPNNVNIYYYQSHAPILQYLFVNFYSLAPLGIVGFFLALFHYRKHFWRPLFWFVLIQIALLTFFYALARLRMPLQATIIPFAAYTFFWLYQQRKSTQGWIVLGITLLLALGIFLQSKKNNIRHADYVVPYKVYYEPLIQSADQQKNWSEAVVLMKNFLQYEPYKIAVLKSESDFLDLKIGSQNAAFYGKRYTEYAEFQKRAGNLVEAEIWKAKAEILKKDRK